MEAVRIVEKVESDTLVLHNLSRYKGQDVEIIIFPHGEEKKKRVKLEDLPRRRYGKIQNSLSRTDIYDDER